MTLHRGAREIQIRFLGRAHTAGDVVVYLPRERIVITGDMLTTGLSNMSDAFVNEWVTTLDELKKLDFDTVLPGHGDAFTDKAKIDYFQAYLRDVWTEVGRLKQQGVSAEEAVEAGRPDEAQGTLPEHSGSRRSSPRSYADLRPYQVKTKRQRPWQATIRRIGMSPRANVASSCWTKVRSARRRRCSKPFSRGSAMRRATAGP